MTGLLAQYWQVMLVSDYSWTPCLFPSMTGACGMHMNSYLQELELLAYTGNSLVRVWAASVEGEGGWGGGGGSAVLCKTL
jgi:hypothetical protein